jgi:YD repeat-containing protein
MKTFVLICFVLLRLQAGAQYYYKDIVGTAESNALMQLYKSGKVSRVALTSYDGDNIRSEDFAVSQVFDMAAGTLRTATQSGMTDASVLTSYTNAAGQVIKTTDSSAAGMSTTEYAYRPDGKLLSVTSVSADAKSNFKISETHLWQYGANHLAGMLRIRNGKDTSVITLVTDEQGNITEEHSSRNGVKGEPVYYYYNDKGQLTDIVRYNTKAKRLLPEYMFEYNDKGQVIQRITFPSNSSEYTIWRYQYNPQGLRIREAIYNKQKELTGKVEYSYQ